MLILNLSTEFVLFKASGVLVLFLLYNCRLWTRTLLCESVLGLTRASDTEILIILCFVFEELDKTSKKMNILVWLPVPVTRGCSSGSVFGF